MGLHRVRRLGPAGRTADGIGCERLHRQAGCARSGLAGALPADDRRSQLRCLDCGWQIGLHDRHGAVGRDGSRARSVRCNRWHGFARSARPGRAGLLPVNDRRGADVAGDVWQRRRGRGCLRGDRRQRGVGRACRLGRRASGRGLARPRHGLDPAQRQRCRGGPLHDGARNSGRRAERVRQAGRTRWVGAGQAGRVWRRRGGPERRAEPRRLHERSDGTSAGALDGHTPALDTLKERQPARGEPVDPLGDRERTR